MFSIARRIGLRNMPYIALTAAQRSWYPNRFTAPITDNEPSLSHALESLEHLVATLGKLGIGKDRIVFLGFSQGACLVCEYVYRNAARWGGLIAFTGGLIGPGDTCRDSSSRLEGTPVIMSNGDQDEWVPLERTSDSARIFNEMGAQVQLQVFPGRAHLVNDEEIASARALLNDLLGQSQHC